MEQQELLEQLVQQELEQQEQHLVLELEELHSKSKHVLYLQQSNRMCCNQLQ